ncbi:MULTISPECIES: type VI secretion system baseplate subunit TssE [Xanthomonas translucens group]|uniref:Type VI secretion system baseplate subunit TssE n=1 Tax=Xanthomonas cerealis pv. cerealis TaxID=152263 RepID=A0A514EDM8_9XANT|nr:type VI secretion system baseplate subunit TssE [Xanthomonas translucens]QDI04119.1 type VI secretion system baseplate subunit TssE [Xanthomonas translucens pv. cerealis]UKE46098.1 type VI secretion system baseplate subunit TssE [Xanthomonas translucens pv. cerealis]UKE68452.1 type VI secretion system baseplate subunit TssE [Xanthomonas translucens pv. pistacia]
MAELTQQERLQPSLLDRLSDDRRHEPAESREARTITAARLRACIVRDLGWLLNCTRHHQADDFEAHPYVAESVLNYGIPDLAGVLLAGLDVSALQNRLRAAIVAFEPRLAASSLQVTAQVDEQRMDRLSLTFLIEAQMWAQPLPLALYLRTEVDLESGRFTVHDGVH